MPPAAADGQEQRSPEEGIPLDIDLIAKQLDVAGTEIQPSSARPTISAGRDRNPAARRQSALNSVIDAGNAKRDSFGQIHARGVNLQDRLNGVQLPEAINVLGQATETRLANSVTLITGALPPQYELRTAGIVEIRTKAGTLGPGGLNHIVRRPAVWLQRSVEFAAWSVRSITMRPAKFLQHGRDREPDRQQKAMHDLNNLWRRLCRPHHRPEHANSQRSSAPCAVRDPQHT